MRFRIALLPIIVIFTSLKSDAEIIWPQFRGPQGDGVVSQRNSPTEFSEEKNVKWKTPIEGKAWSSPVIADNVIWATTAVEAFPTEDEKKKMLSEAGIEERKFKQLAIAKSVGLKLVAMDLNSGKLIKTLDVTSIQKPDPIHSVNSYASPTPIIDGDFIFCHFGTYGTFCIDRETHKVVWERQLSLNHSVGPGSSPFIYNDLLILVQDGVEKQYVAALDKSSGDTIWETHRPEMDAPTGDQKKAFSTPIAITDANGRDQLICMSSQWMVSYDPKSGSEIWKVYHGKGFSVVPRPVYGNGVVYFSTGFGKPELWAVKVDGSGDVTDTHVQWTVKKSIPAKPSPLLHNDLIYVVEDSGIASCLDAETGEEVWKKRLGGKFSSSPIAIGQHIYFASHEGVVTVIKAGRECEIIAENQLDGQIMASPAVVGDAMIWRTADAMYRIES